MRLVMKGQIHQRYKNNSAAGYVSSSLTVCATPFFVHKIILTEKIAVTFFFCLQDQNDRNAINYM